MSSDEYPLSPSSRTRCNRRSSTISATRVPERRRCATEWAFEISAECVESRSQFFRTKRPSRAGAFADRNAAAAGPRRAPHGEELRQRDLADRSARRDSREGPQHDDGPAARSGAPIRGVRRFVPCLRGTNYSRRPITVGKVEQRLPHGGDRLRGLQEADGGKSGHVDRACSGTPQGIRGASAAGLGYPRRRRKESARDRAADDEARAERNFQVGQGAQVRRGKLNWHPRRHHPIASICRRTKARSISCSI